ncbi:MAG: hypothetical protein LLG16_08820 [Euryarchaeota archaeon]|nr:hypothetical protein [Euryarchaeota archaeon]
MISVLMIMAFLALAFVPMTAHAEEEESTSGIDVELIGPTVLQVGVKTQYKIVATSNITGANYTWSATLGGDLGGDATASPMVGGPKASGIFYFNITAPDSAGKFNVKIVVKAVNSTANASETLKVNLKARDPVVLTATVKNAANVTVTGVPVYFYLNDDSANPVEIYNTTVTVAALSSKTVRYNWTSYDLDSGEHEIKVVIDPDSNFVTLNDDGKVSTLTIYYGVQGYGTITAWLWALVAILAVLLFFLYMRPAKRKKKKKKR